jgi:CheY-like chemotaxis protein
MNSNLFEIPASLATQRLPASSGDKAHGAHRSGATAMRVLLVEDMRDNQITACKLLFRLGIIPVIAENGLMAVKMFQEQMFDCILMDISMPVMDGLEATQKIRREELSQPDRPRCPIVAYTSGGTADHRELWREIGIDAVLNKPSQLEQMEACLRQWCGQIIDASARFDVGLGQN